MKPIKNSFGIQATLLLAGSLTVMAGATIAPSLPQMSKVFSDVPHAEFLSKLILTLPALFIAILAPVMGFVIDKFGRLKLLGICLVLYALSGTTGLYLDNIYMILLGRAGLGVAVAGIMTTSTTLIGDYFQQEARNRFLSLQGAFMALGGMVFVGTGGALADISWRSPFSLYFFSILLIPLVYFVLYEPERIPRPAKGSPKGAPDPNNGTIWLLYITGFWAMLLFYLIPVQLPFLLKTMHIESNSSAGIAIAVTTFSGAVMSFLYQRAKKNMSYQTAYAIAFFIMGIGFTIVSIANSYALVITGMVFSGLGAGWLMPNTNLWLLSMASPQKRGRIIGGIATAFFLGQFFSPILAEPIRNAWSIQAAFLLGAMVLGVMFAGYAIFAMTHRKQVEIVQKNS